MTIHQLIEQIKIFKETQSISRQLPVTNKVFCLRINGLEVWKAIWRGQVARAEWSQRGPAQAWLDLCEKTGKFRS